MSEKIVENKIEKVSSKSIFAFLKSVVQLTERALQIKGTEYLQDNEDRIENEGVDVYVIGNEILNPSCMLEVNVYPERILVYIYNDNLILLDIVKEEFLKMTKKLGISNWEINY